VSANQQDALASVRVEAPQLSSLKAVGPRYMTDRSIRVQHEPLLVLMSKEWC